MYSTIYEQSITAVNHSSGLDTLFINMSRVFILRNTSINFIEAENVILMEMNIILRTFSKLFWNEAKLLFINLAFALDLLPGKSPWKIMNRISSLLALLMCSVHFKSSVFIAIWFHTYRRWLSIAFSSCLVKFFCLLNRLGNEIGDSTNKIDFVVHSY